MDLDWIWRCERRREGGARGRARCPWMPLCLEPLLERESVCLAGSVWLGLSDWSLVVWSGLARCFVSRPASAKDSTRA